MLALLIHRSRQQICYQIYKFYQKKYSLQFNGQIQINIDNLAEARWSIGNSQNKIVTDTTIDIARQASPQTIDYQKVASAPDLCMHNFDIIVNKISHGGDEYNDITLLSSQALEQLSNYSYLAPIDQEEDLALTKSLLMQFPKAKHYACFETAFHSSIPNNLKMLLPALEYAKSGIKNYGCNGLLFSGLNSKLHDITDKKIAKGKWLIINLNDTETTICALKNNKSMYCTSSLIHHELISFNHSGLIDPSLTNFLVSISNKNQINCLNEICSLNMNKLPAINNINDILHSHEPEAKLLASYYIQQISNSVGKLAIIIKGVHGIIFTGNIGANNPKLRSLICDHLECFNVEISNKSNNDNKFKLHKKSSKVEIYTTIASPLDGMLYQLLDRI